MTENKRFGLEMDKNCYKCIVDIRNKKLYTDKKQVVDLLNDLSNENEQLKQQLNDKETEWLRNNTVWEQMPTSKRTIVKTTFGDKND